MGEQRSWRRRLARPVTAVATVALLLQLSLPPVFALPMYALLAFGGICHAGGAQDDPHAPADPGHACCQCLFCHAVPVAFLPSANPAQLGAADAGAAIAIAPPVDRAPPAFRPAYASRAPPMIG